MATHKTPVVDGFDVVVERIVGHVDLRGGTHKTPFHAAMDLIASNDEDGTYRFPGPMQGQTIIITVEGLTAEPLSSPYDD